MIGHLFFLVPFTIILLWTSIPFFLTSFRIREQSFSAGGLPQWPAKSLIMIGMALLLLQGGLRDHQTRSGDGGNDPPTLMRPR